MIWPIGKTLATISYRTPLLLKNVTWARKLFTHIESDFLVSEEVSFNFSIILSNGP